MNLYRDQSKRRCFSIVSLLTWSLSLSATFSLAAPPEGPHGKQITCPALNFFNVRKQSRTEISLDDPPSGWEIVSTQNQAAKEDIWYPTIPTGAHIFIRQSDIYLRCEYKPRNWVQLWIPGAATIEKKLGPFRLQLLCWTFEGLDKTPIHRVLTKDDSLFLPCMEGVCDAICSY
ncbi:MAG: hypothetical protein HYR96_12415 [Deltaproteobacteria bacterium]|nr:hypothetical protein [Deltaproteobacteria bacterium]MBI3296137.1 hypothetical protein [Deltaproteobacteria bacterium]